MQTAPLRASFLEHRRMDITKTQQILLSHCLLTRPSVWQFANSSYRNDAREGRPATLPKCTHGPME
jgi:hypothetical protein